jgi:peptidoglycan/xylan/chitin deacetylase (PgdA/CDA1 family)
LGALKLAALPYGLIFRERRPGLIILIYHRVGGNTASDIDLPAALFARQMEHVRARYTPLALDAIVDGPGAAVPRDRDLVAVTFDDGFRDVYEHAYPVLQRLGIPATVYLATHYVEAQQAFDFGGYAGDAARPMPMTWAQAREMAASGLISFGGHTHSHTDLTRLDEASAREEVVRCRGLIEDRLGRPARHFAYPWGVVNPTARRIVGESFATATRGGSAKNLLATMDRLALWRRPIQQGDGYALFRLKVASYLDGEEAFRTLAQRLRNRGARGGNPDG